MKHLIGFLFIALFAHGTPCGQVAQALTDYDRQEFIQKNMLADKNAGFESGISQWSGTPALVKATGGNILYGKGSATWDSTSASQTMSSASGTMPNGLLGQNCEASILIAVPSGTATHNIQAFVGTDIISVPIVSSVTPRRQVVTFPCPVAATTIRIRIQSVAANEPLIAFDDAYIGVATNVGTGSVDTPSVAYTPTFNSTTGHAASNGWWYRAGDRIVIGGSILFNGTGAASTVSVTVPSNCTIDLAKLNDSASYASLRNSAGHWSWYDDAGSAAVNPQWVRVVSATTLEFVNGSNAILSNIFANNDRVSWTANLPCVGWVASTVVTANQQRAPNVIRYTSGSGTYTPTAGTTYITVDMNGAGGGGGGDGAGSTTGAAGLAATFGGSSAGGGGGGGSSATSYGGSGGINTVGAGHTARQNISGAAGQSGFPNAAAQSGLGGSGGGSCNGSGAGGGGYNQAGASGAANSGGGGGGGGASSTVPTNGGGGGGGGGCLSLLIATPSVVSYSVPGAATAGAAGTGGWAGGLSGSGSITVTEYFGATTALLANSVSTDVVNGEKIVRVGVDTVCNSSPCTLARNSGFTNVTRAGTGNYTATFATPFSSPPECYGNGSSSVATFLLFSAATTTSVGFQSFAGAVITDNGFRIWCVGPR